MSNKLNGLSLNQANILISALKSYKYGKDIDSTEDKKYLLLQLRFIKAYLERI